MPELETIKGILLKVDGNIINVATHATDNAQTVFRYTHSAIFEVGCQGEAQTFTTESAPRGLCRLLSYKCDH